MSCGYVDINAVTKETLEDNDDYQEANTMESIPQIAISID